MKTVFTAKYLPYSRSVLENIGLGFGAYSTNNITVSHNVQAFNITLYKNGVIVRGKCDFIGSYDDAYALAESWANEKGGELSAFRRA